MRTLAIVAASALAGLFATAALADRKLDKVELVAPLPLDVNVTNPTPNSCPSFELVGTTRTAFLGTEGPMSFSRACAADFPGSRWCTSAEVLSSVNPPGFRAVAWVRAVFVLVSESSFMDVSGLLAPAPDFTCDTWSISRTDAVGLVVDGRGIFRTHRCSSVRTAACCAPAR